MTINPNLPAELHGRVLVAGAGVSGTGSARLLRDLGVDVTVADDDAAARERVAEFAATASVAEARAGLAGFSVVVTSPGWRPDSPLLLDAASAGREVIGDVELAYRLDRAGVFGPPRTWLVVTGTNGKTTTTAMLAAMMAEGQFRSRGVGNIGLAVSDVLRGPERVDVLVAELSSFQLHWSTELTPDAGILLNLAEDHIDWHGSFAAYAADKAKALTGAVAVAGTDDPNVREQVERARPTRAIGFTLGVPEPGQFGVHADQLVDNSAGEMTALAPVEGIEPPGPAGVLDALAAAAVARSQGVTPAQIAAALASYHVADHRGQVVHRAGGVEVVDNSKATNPHAADSALAGLDSVLWVAGGQLKGAELDELIRTHGPRLKAVFLLGADRGVFVDALSRWAPQVPVTVTDSTEPGSAMRELLGHAAALSRPGDTVLLAPAAASLDMFTGMAQRGDLFAAAARETMAASTTGKESQGDRT